MFNKKRKTGEILPTPYEEEAEKRRFPAIGARIMKTTVAVFICLIIYYLRGYHGSEMPTEACITAIVCMQPYVRDSRDYAINRFTGTMIGAVIGLLFLLLTMVLPHLGYVNALLYLGMAVGVLLCLYTAVLVRKPDTASLAAIVFLCVVIAFPDIENPLRMASSRILDLFIGTVVAIGVNISHLPRERHPERVIFIRTKDLVPDRFSMVTPAVLFRLNRLYEDGAKICLMSEHAPAFFMLQMNNTRLNTPLIVMDGAAIYDANINYYIRTETIEEEESEQLHRRLQALGISYFVYTVHNEKTCIFHYGEFRETEKVVYGKMRRSPYRDYLEGEVYDPNEIVYFKVIDEDARLVEIESHLYKVMPKGKVRAVRRKQAGTKGISGLYIYSHTATMEQAKKHLMHMMSEMEGNLEAVEIRAREPYHSERGAMHLLYRVRNCYEPVKLFRWFRRKKDRQY